MFSMQEYQIGRTNVGDSGANLPPIEYAVQDGWREIRLAVSDTARARQISKIGSGPQGLALVTDGVALVAAYRYERGMLYLDRLADQPARLDPKARSARRPVQAALLPVVGIDRSGTVVGLRIAGVSGQFLHKLESITSDRERGRIALAMYQQKLELLYRQLPSSLIQSQVVARIGSDWSWIREARNDFARWSASGILPRAGGSGSGGAPAIAWKSVS